MVPLTLFTKLFFEGQPQPTHLTARCLRSRLNTNECQKCLEGCPAGALSVHGRKIVLDSAQCTGCMSCVAACPQDALISGDDLDNLLRSLQSGSDVSVSCIRQPVNHPEDIVIPCVGIVSKPVLLAIFLSDCCRSVTFNLTGCTECCNRSAAKKFLTKYRQVWDTLSDICKTKVVLVKDREQQSDPSMDRRSYLTKLRDIAVDASKKRFFSSQVTPLDSPQNSRRIPFKTQLVKKVVTNLHGDSKTKVIDLFGYNLSLNAACNYCPLCKGICPTGAIKIDRSSQGKSFRFAILACSGCGLCVEFCKKNALVLNQISVNYPELHRTPKNDC